MGERVLVSVVMITYGHEKYIRQAIEGVLMQQGDFDLELVIANDCSPDNTDAVVQDVLSHHSNAHWIRYVRHEKNIGMMPNFIFALQQAKGNYIALCDGDDYWTDPYKLQKQVDFLEANPDFVIHSGVARTMLEDNLTKNYIGLDDASRTFFIEDFYKQNNLVTCTVMFKNVLRTLPDDFAKITFGDWCLYVLLMKESNLKAYRSTEIFSVYRIHPSGVMSSLSLRKNNQLHIEQITKIKKLVGYHSFSISTINAINRYSFDKFKIEFEENHFISAIITFVYNIYLCKNKVSVKNYLRVLKNRIL